MVRGRRYRTVTTVSCSRTDECCSPNPKKKDIGHNEDESEQTNSKASSFGAQIISKLLNVVASNYPVEGTVVGDIFKAETGTIANDLIIMQQTCDTMIESKQTDTKEFLGSPPSIKKLKDVVSPPTTPHRIELKADEDEKLEEPAPLIENTIKSEKICVKVTNTKSKRGRNVQQKTEVTSHKLTEYFPVRRSVRVPTKVVLEEKQRNLVNTLKMNKDEGLKVCYFDDKGRGVVADRNFERGDFVVEYAGDLISIAEAKRREEQYASDHNAGCYMYYFKHKGQQYCIDATAETGRLGRLVNHSRNGNLQTKTIEVNNVPRLVLVARDSIEIGEELTYDYGDRSKESLKHHPWLAY